MSFYIIQYKKLHLIRGHIPWVYVLVNYVEGQTSLQKVILSCRICLFFIYKLSAGICSNSCRLSVFGILALHIFSLTRVQFKRCMCSVLPVWIVVPVFFSFTCVVRFTCVISFTCLISFTYVFSLTCEFNFTYVYSFTCMFDFTCD